MSRHSYAGRRRTLLKLSMAGAVPILWRGAFVQAADPVDENDPMAKQLAYVHDASQSNDPKRQADQTCANCQLFQAADGEEWGGCPLFQDKLVNAEGWCNGWVPKPG